MKALLRAAAADKRAAAVPPPKPVKSQMEQQAGGAAAAGEAGPSGKRKRPSAWSKDEVQRWLKLEGYEKYESHLAFVDGSRLKRLTLEDLGQLCIPVFPAQALLEDIAKLP